MSGPVCDEALLCCQPVLDRQQQLCGYELALQPPHGATIGGRSPAAALICAVYAELGIGSALGHSVSFLRVDAELLHDDAIEALPATAVVLELSLDAAPSALTVERCRTLRERHYRLALADYGGLDERSAPLLNLVDIVEIDIARHDDGALRQLAGPLAHLPLKRLAKGVETPHDMVRCREIGFDYFQGRHFAHPEIVSGRHLTASQTHLITLINLVARDSDTSLLEDAIKHDPALSIKLLRIVNTVAYGPPRPISSLRDALTVLGRRQLQRWLHLLLMTPAGSTADAGRSPLLQLAALRGRMMETLIEHCAGARSGLADQAFITGLMSMMPAALGLPLDEIIAQITLDAEVVAALTARRGALGPTLALIDAFDAEDAVACDALLAQSAHPALTRSTLNSCLIDALHWIGSYAS